MKIEKVPAKVQEAFLIKFSAFEWSPCMGTENSDKNFLKIFQNNAGRICY